MTDKSEGLLEGVNIRDANGHWGNVERPSSIPEQGQKREVLLVDAHGRELLVREPRAVGFRKP